VSPARSHFSAATAGSSRSGLGDAGVGSAVNPAMGMEALGLPYSVGRIPESQATSRRHTTQQAGLSRSANGGDGSMKAFLRRLRGAIGNALAWAISWFGASLALLSAMKLVGALPAWELVLYVAANIGVTGLLTGGVFSAFLRAAYADRPLLSIRVGRLALAGAAIAATCTPLVGLVLRSLAGQAIVAADLLAGAPLAAVLGALTAGGTIHVAQREARRLASGATAELETEQRQAMALLDG
jgi:hypothetical protein